MSTHLSATMQIIGFIQDSPTDMKRTTHDKLLSPEHILLVRSWVLKFEMKTTVRIIPRPEAIFVCDVVYRVESAEDGLADIDLLP